MSTAVGVDVSVTPETFTLVNYDAGEIAEIAANVWQRIGLPEGRSLRLEIDETTPLGRANIVSVDPPVLALESGALEDSHRPRCLSRPGSEDVIGRLLFKLGDRIDPAFGEPPDDDDIPLTVSSAWDVYAVGRLSRLGFPNQRQRRLYQFRVRHGFADQVDAVFNQLWNAEDLTWTGLLELSERATNGS
jgi:hypothetical protein